MLASYLRARTVASATAAQGSATADLSSVFPSDHWEVRLSLTAYTDANYRNLWNNEVRGAVRSRLESQGHTQADYASFLGEVHFVSAVAGSRRLFRDGYRDNQGWRVLALGVPPAGVIAVGLASHYQNAQNHNRLGVASAVFFERIASICAAANVPVSARAVQPTDWDRTTLMPEPILEVLGTDISSIYDEEPGLWLKEVRTTTVKKTVASFMTLEVVSSTCTDAELLHKLESVRTMAEVLLEVEA
jgi:5-methylcytosine-specific restriction protein B